MIFQKKSFITYCSSELWKEYWLKITTWCDLDTKEIHAYLWKTVYSIEIKPGKKLSQTFGYSITV